MGNCIDFRTLRTADSSIDYNVIIQVRFLFDVVQNDYARNVCAGLSLIESVAEAWQPV